MTTNAVESIKAINVEAASLASSIKVLGSISWPDRVLEEFLGQHPDLRKNPTPPMRTFDYSEQINKLTSLLARVQGSSPIEVFTRRSLESLRDGALMIQAVGTPRFQDMSIQVYGRPQDPVLGAATGLDLAKSLLGTIDSFAHPHIEPPELCVSARMIKHHMEEHIRPIFGRMAPSIDIVDHLPAKATASATSIKLRGGTSFSLYDYDQLLYHEALIHSLTAINGLQQPVLALMGKSIPRATMTQEGLATFAEIITGSIDLGRLKRLALRVIAIDMALDGADFMDIYRFFINNEESERESFLSASRVFRGGDPKGGIIFTKDCVYLVGLLSIDALFRWAIKTENVGYLHILMAGRVALEDIGVLYRALKEDLIIPPRFLPPWYERIEGLAGILIFGQMRDFFKKRTDSYFAQLLKD